tara:strand:- start:735 stop:953 length:219 start_codon:yes stop_codon:yes gene_type:complete
MRLYLHRQDIQELNEVSGKEALNIMRDIRETYNLPKKRYVSISAYCKYFHQNTDLVLEAISNTKRRIAINNM